MPLYSLQDFFTTLKYRFIPFEGSLYSCLTMRFFERKSVREISVIHSLVTLCEMKYSEG